MDITITYPTATVAVIQPHGRLELSTAPRLRQCLQEAIASGHVQLVVDLSDVPSLDSTGVGALISGLKGAYAASGDLRLANVGAQVRMVLDLASLHGVLRRYATVKDACDSYM